jgi:hypothetical protein
MLSASRIAVAALVLVAGSAATAQASISLQWTFDGVAASEFSLNPNDSMTVEVGLLAAWQDDTGTAIAFGGVNQLAVTLGASTGSDFGDTVSNLSRLAPFDFGPVGNAGTASVLADAIEISGISPGQNQFVAPADMGNPSGVFWTFDFTIGDTSERSILLSLDSVRDGMLFTGAGQPAVMVEGADISLSDATINVIPAPATAMLACLGGLAMTRRRR